MSTRPIGQTSLELSPTPRDLRAAARAAKRAATENIASEALKKAAPSTPVKKFVFNPATGELEELRSDKPVAGIALDILMSSRSSQKQAEPIPKCEQALNIDADGQLVVTDL